MNTIDPLKLCPECVAQLRATASEADTQVAAAVGLGPLTTHTVGGTLEPAPRGESGQDILTACPS
jgi:hypothetical protein